MGKNYFASPIINVIVDFLTRNNIPYTIGKNHSIMVSGYPVSGKLVSVQIVNDIPLNVLLLQAEAVDPIPENELDVVYEFINILNSRTHPGKYFLCPHCNRLTHRLELLLTNQSLTDAEISLYLEETVRALLTGIEAVTVLLDQSIDATDDVEGDASAPDGV